MTSLTTLQTRTEPGFDSIALPTQRDEAWKYTNLNRLKDFSLAPSAPSTEAVVAPEPLLERAPHRLVFVDGRFSAKHSAIGALPEGVVLSNLASMADADLIGHLASTVRRPMVAINSSYLEDGLVLIVPNGVTIPDPIGVVFIGQQVGAACHPRNIVRLGDQASATLVERHVTSAGAGLLNAVTEIALGQGAQLGHYALHEEAAEATALSMIFAELKRDASYRAFSLTLGGGLVRRENDIALAGPGGSCQIDGAYLVDGKRHADTTTLVDHRAPHCSSRQTLKGIVDGHGRAVFQGKVLVRPDAQKTDAYQLSQTMLLSPEAEIDVKPELEIYADDVKCSHGATSGRLDLEALFYLRARGIPERQAQAMLIQGFIDGALDEIDCPDVRDSFKGAAAVWLDAPKAAS